MRCMVFFIACVCFDVRIKAYLEIKAFFIMGKVYHCIFSRNSFWKGTSIGLIFQSVSFHSPCETLSRWVNVYQRRNLKPLFFQIMSYSRTF